MPSLYFFRHHITQKVLVSPKVLLEHTPHNRLLNQIGEHRPQAKIRPDHWVPFAILSGLPNQQIADKIFKMVVPDVYDDGFWLGKQRLPIYPKRKQNEKKKDPSEFYKWTIPEALKEKTTLLCKVLSNPEISAELESVSLAVKVDSQKSKKKPDGYTTSFLSIPFPTSIASFFPKNLLHRLFPKRAKRPTLPKVKRIYSFENGPHVPYTPMEVPENANSTSQEPVSPGITLHWEREEYQNLPLEQDVMWPFYVQHKKLQLIRNSWPVVDDFDCLSHKDKFTHEMAQRHREERLIRIGWDLDDHLRKRFPHSRKVSSKFRERLILNMTGGVKPRSIIRSIRGEVRKRERVQKTVERSGLLGSIDSEVSHL